MAREAAIAVVGLGYVGLPVAVAFSAQARVIGFDIQKAKIAAYRRGADPTNEVGDEAVAACHVDFTDDERRLREASFIIVAVPTPVDADNRPDLSIVEHASRVVGRNLSKGATVVFESTVYPGVTEKVCLPILEAESGLRCGEGFKLGYSPERINPGDKEHRLDTIVKVVAASDDEALDDVARVYGMVAKAGVHRAPSIRVAEAAKVIENSQRDINIAFMNELSVIFHKLGLDTEAVLEAAGTKWNFLKFTPGLVGGHCVGVDPYYLTYKAAQVGYDSGIMAQGRRINDGMSAFVIEQMETALAGCGVPLAEATVAVVGLTFKENCPDTRNSRAIDMVSMLRERGATVLAADPVADPAEVQREHGICLVPMTAIREADVVVAAVAHEALREYSLRALDAFFKANGARLLFDLKGIWSRKEAEKAGFGYWRL